MKDKGMELVKKCIELKENYMKLESDISIGRFKINNEMSVLLQKTINYLQRIKT